MKKILVIILSLFILAGCELFKEDLFERNKECFKYAEKLREEYEKNNVSIEGVFYSPKMNSCLYIYGISTSTLEPHYIYLVDVFTNETVFEYAGTMDEFQKEIEEYKIEK